MQVTNLSKDLTFNTLISSTPTPPPPKKTKKKKKNLRYEDFQKAKKFNN